jgi:hypothetical protein
MMRLFKKGIRNRISTFQAETGLTIPDDLIAYFNLSDRKIKEYEEDMFVFYNFNDFKTVKDEVGNFSGIPDYTNIINTLAAHENCFVFAEYCIHVSVYAIRLYAYKSLINVIYAIIGDEYKVVANSFTEFIEIYKNDFGDVLF